MIRFSKKGLLVLTEEQADIARLRSSGLESKIEQKMFHRMDSALVMDAKHLSRNDQMMLKLTFHG